MKIKSTMIVAIAALALVSCGKKSGGSLADLQDNEFAVRTVGGSTADLQTTYPATIKGIQTHPHPSPSHFVLVRCLLRTAYRVRPPFDGLSDGQG